MLIKHAEIDGRLVDLRVHDCIVEVGESLSAHADEVLDARGCAVLPGLHDHHIHLFAAAAASTSLDCEILEFAQSAEFVQALASVPGDDWVRVVGYHEGIAGDLDAAALDKLCAERPVRVQHSSGKLWVLNSLAMQRLALAGAVDTGIERDVLGQPTGRLWRMDDWLQTRLSAAPPNIAELSQRLASFGVTGVTDASYTNTSATLAYLEAARRAGELQQRTYVMGDESISAAPLKVMLDEDDLPDFEALVERVRAAHGLGRGVAFHCVSHVELVFVLAALSEAGYDAQDRIEHAGVVRPECLATLVASGASVVTQPGFIWARGDRYLEQADAVDLAYLYPYATLLQAGVPVAASSDAPYGPLDPWRVMSSAVTRQTQAGHVLGPADVVLPIEALRGYLSDPCDPGGDPRRLLVGAPADLCVLDRKLADCFADLAAVRVNHTVINGRQVYAREDSISSLCSPR